MREERTVRVIRSVQYPFVDGPSCVNNCAIGFVSVPYKRQVSYRCKSISSLLEIWKLREVKLFVDTCEVVKLGFEPRSPCPQIQPLSNHIMAATAFQM